MSTGDPVPHVHQTAVARDQAIQFVLGSGQQHIHFGSGNSRGPVPSAYWATVAEIRRRTQVLAGREDDLARITSFVAGDAGYLWLTGEAWAGKTAVLAEAVTAPPDNTDVVCYFLSRREADADITQFLAAVVPQLAFVLGEDPPAAGLHEFRALWQRAACRAQREDRRLLLVVDGLDEDIRPSGLPSVAAMLPAAADGRAHVLVSSRANTDLPADLPVGHPLRVAVPVPVQPFSGARELEVLARQEIDDLLRDDGDGLAADVLGLLAAAAGPLGVRDLAALTVAVPQSAVLARRIRRLLTTSAARSVQAAGLVGGDRYQFAHESLLAYAQDDVDLGDAGFRRRIGRWAEQWGAAGWPVPGVGGYGTPRYLLDSYPATLASEPGRLSGLAGDAGWVEAAVTAVGVDAVLATVRRAAAADPASARVAAVLAAVAGQAHALRPPYPVGQPGYVLRQLWMHAAELGEDDLAAEITGRLRARPGAGLVPCWTTRRVSRALSGELGRHDGSVEAAAVLIDGRVVTSGSDGRLLVWNPADPGDGPDVLGRHNREVRAVAVLRDGRVVASGGGGRVLVWDPADSGAGPVELGRHRGGVRAVTVLGDGRVVTGGSDGRILAWDPADPGAAPTELGRHDRGVGALAVLGDGRLVTSGSDGRLLVWDLSRPGDGSAVLNRPQNHAVGAVAVLGDGRVVTSGSDGWLLVWDLARPGDGPAVLGRHDRGVRAVAVLGDGQVVTGGHDGRLLVWDSANPGDSPAELGRHDGAVRAVAVIEDERIVTGGEDGRVLAWDAADHGDSPVELDRHDRWVRAMAVLADGRVVTSGLDGRLLVWDHTVPSDGPTVVGRHRGGVRAMAVLGDGRVVTGGEDGRVLAWDPDPGTRPAVISYHDGWVRAVAVLSNGRIVTGGSDGRVLVRDPANPGTRPAVLGRHDREVAAVAVLGDGRVVSGGGDGRVLVWDTANPGIGMAELGRHDGPVRAVAVLGDRRVVTGGGDRWVQILDLARDGGPVVQLTCSVIALATAPPGQAGYSLAIAHQGSGLSLWSIPA